MGWVASFLVATAFLAASWAVPAAAADCQNHPWAGQPCPGVAEKWEDFLELQDLHASLAAARSFEAFMNGRDDEAAHFLAIARGGGPESSLTGGEKDSLEVARAQRQQEAGCIADPFSSTPCLGTAGAWERYAAERGLEQSWEGSRGFVARLSRRGAAEADTAGMAARPARDDDEPASDARTPGGLIIQVYPGSRFEGS